MPSGLTTATPTLEPGIIPDSSLPSGNVGEGVPGNPGEAPPGDVNAPPGGPAPAPAPSGDAIQQLLYQHPVFVSLGGQEVAPLQWTPGGVGGGAAIGRGTIFDVNQYDQVAAYDGANLSVNGQSMIISPASQFGLDPAIRVEDIAWSPDGHYVAFRVNDTDPSRVVTNSGVWIYEPAPDPAQARSWQVFRDTPRAAQQDQIQRAIDMQWSPNSVMLVVTIDMIDGRANTYMPYNQDVNQQPLRILWSDATWSLDSQSLIVSGTYNFQKYGVGQFSVSGVPEPRYYLEQGQNGLAWMKAAIERPGGSIAFLGGRSLGSFGLYSIDPATAQLLPLTNEVPGTVLAAEWDEGRTAVLVTVDAGGARQLWLIPVGGVPQNVTPLGAAWIEAHFR